MRGLRMLLLEMFHLRVRPVEFVLADQRKGAKGCTYIYTHTLGFGGLRLHAHKVEFEDT